MLFECELYDELINTLVPRYFRTRPSMFKLIEFNITKIDWFHKCIFHLENDDNSVNKKNLRKILITQDPPVMWPQPIAWLVAIMFSEFAEERHVWPERRKLEFTYCHVLRGEHSWERGWRFAFILQCRCGWCSWGRAYTFRWPRFQVRRRSKSTRFSLSRCSALRGRGSAPGWHGIWATCQQCRSEFSELWDNEQDLDAWHRCRVKANLPEPLAGKKKDGPRTGAGGTALTMQNWVPRGRKGVWWWPKKYRSLSYWTGEWLVLSIFRANWTQLQTQIVGSSKTTAIGNCVHRFSKVFKKCFLRSKWISLQIDWTTRFQDFGVGDRTHWRRA